MNKIILMIGSIILTYFVILIISPSYSSVEKKLKIKSERDYNLKCNIMCILISLMINFLIWGWFI